MGTYLFILIIGFIAGFINTIAAGGSLLTLPILIFLGLPTAVANGTNRIALMLQSIVGVWSFRRKGFFNWRLSLWFGIPAMAGSIIGAKLAISTPDSLFNKILAVVMIVVLWLTIKPTRKKAPEGENPSLSKPRLIIGVLIFLLIGIYGGFIQAGVGFFIIATMSVLTELSLVQINSIKVFVVGLYMVSSLGFYIYHNEIDWTLGLILAAGNSAGAWVGSNFAAAKGEKWIKWILTVVIVGMAVKLFFKF